MKKKNKMFYSLQVENFNEYPDNLMAEQPTKLI